MFIRVCLVLCILLLNSCIGTLIGVTATTAALGVVRDKSIGSAIDDAALWTKINTKLIEANMFANVRVKVDEGRVLLAGSVKSTKDRIDLAKMVWEEEGVIEVMNEVEINNPESSFINSTWITGQIRAKLLLAANVRSMNYSVDTINGVVYLIGVAQSGWEHDEVLAITSKTPGVKEIISYVRVKNIKPSVKVRTGNDD